MTVVRPSGRAPDQLRPVRIERGLGNTTAAQTYAERLKFEYPRAAQTKELLESERNPG